MDAASFGPVQQMDAGPLDVGYVEVGPPNGQPVVLLHGWPYDIHSYAEAAPALAAAGYRVVVPHLRGYGTTRFLSDDAVRNGQQAALAVDVINLMDALRDSLGTKNRAAKTGHKKRAAGKNGHRRRARNAG